MDEQADFLSVDEVAAYLGFSERVVRDIPPSLLPYFQQGRKGRRRYHRLDVMRYVEKRTVRQ